MRFSNYFSVGDHKTLIRRFYPRGRVLPTMTYTSEPGTARIAFTICSNQFLSLKNGHECPKLKLVSKMGSNKWTTNFSLEYSVWKNTTTISEVSLLSKIFPWNGTKAVFHLLFNRIFRNFFVNGKQVNLNFSNN